MTQRKPFWFFPWNHSSFFGPKSSNNIIFQIIALTKLDLDSMFKNTFQSGFLSILYSIGSKPLQIWDKKVRNGHIKRITDPDIQSFVLEIVGTNVSTTYITCPADPRKTLGIKLPYLVMIVKNMKKYFTFEVQVRNNDYFLHGNLRSFFSRVEQMEKSANQLFRTTF